MTYHTSRLGRVGFLALLALGLIGPIASKSTLAADDAPKIDWREDLGQAQAEAKSRDLLLWIQFTGPWCINCRRMDRATFVHPGVVARSRDHFVPVKLRSDEHEALAQSLGLTSLPSTVIVRPNGEVVEKYEGYVEPETFEVTLREVLRREDRLPEQIAARKKKKLEGRRRGPGRLLPGQPAREAEARPGPARPDRRARRPGLPVRQRGREAGLPDQARRLRPRQRRPMPGQPGRPGRLPPRRPALGRGLQRAPLPLQGRRRARPVRQGPRALRQHRPGRSGLLPASGGQGRAWRAGHPPASPPPSRSPPRRPPPPTGSKPCSPPRRPSAADGRSRIEPTNEADPSTRSRPRSSFRRTESYPGR